MKATIFLFAFAIGCLAPVISPASDSAARREDLQLPRSMHTPMKERARVTVGLHDAAITGADNRALQAAVDYVASLGGGVVEIGAGTYLMRDSLHLRPNVTVQG